MNKGENLIDVKFEKIKILALDFDGTLTLGAHVIISENGQESVICSRRDSLGIEMIKKAGVKVVVISKETNNVVSRRCEKLKIECVQGVFADSDKLSILKSYVDLHKISLDQVAYVGDDVNDILCIEQVGIGVATADAHNTVKEKANYISRKKGGDGAVREICDLILNSLGGAK